MNTTFRALENTNEFLKGLKIHPERNALWEVLHIVRWHKGVDWIMWISFNKELITVIADFDDIRTMPEELYNKVWETVYKIKDLNR